MKQEHKKYEEAIQELETIVSKMENNQLGLDELSSQLKRAQQLIKLCKDRLTKTDTEIKRILENDDRPATTKQEKDDDRPEDAE